MNPDELQIAIYERMNHTSITALLTTGYGVTALFDEWVPQVTDSGDPAFFPFITFSFPNSAPFDDKTNAGHDSIIQIDIWSRTSGDEVKRIAKAVYDRTHRQALSVAGHITTEVQGQSFSRDPDGITRRGMLTLRVMALA